MTAKIDRFKLAAALLPAALLMLSSPPVPAGVLKLASQSAFAAAGIIAYDTNFDAYPDGATPLSDPYTIGGVTYTSGENVIIGVNTGPYPNTRAVLGYQKWSPLTGSIDAAAHYNLFGFDMGYLGSQSAITIDLVTNRGDYQFSVPDPSEASALDFYGFAATGGEYFQSFSLTSAQGPGSAPVITDIRVGTTPLPAALPLFAAALAGLGVAGRRRKVAADASRIAW